MNESFAKGSIEFLTVAVEFCRFIDQAEDRQPLDFTDKLSKLLPLLYLKAAMVEPLPCPDDFEPDHAVDETLYTSVHNAISDLLGPDDQYLTASHPDIALSDNVLTASISEDIADVYQSVRDFTALAQVGDSDLMNAALSLCIADFRDYWGERLLAALHALHSVVYHSEPDDDSLNPKL